MVGNRASARDHAGKNRESNRGSSYRPGLRSHPHRSASPIKMRRAPKSARRSRHTPVEATPRGGQAAGLGVPGTDRGLEVHVLCCGQRPTVIFIKGSWRSLSRSFASSWPHAIAELRAITISNIACRTRSGSRRSGIASASRRHTPSLRSASRNSSRPASDDWLPPSKSTGSFLRCTTGRSKGSSVSSVMAAVAQGCLFTPQSPQNYYRHA
jgi:hypothetical protein